MIITVHEATATDFATLGLGALMPTECTIEEKAGGLYELTLVQPITDDNRHALLSQHRIIKAMAPIRETPLIELDSTGTIEREIYAAHASNGQRLNMRTGPSLDSKVIHAYRQGTEVVKLGVSEDGEWFRVAILDGGATGWMWAEYLDYVRTETETIIGDTPGGIVQPRQTREQLFRIYEVEPDSRLRSVTVRAQHISYDLKGAVIVGEYSPEDVPANRVCLELMNRLDHDVSDFHVYCAVTERVTGQYGGNNLINCLLDPEIGIAAQTGARVIRDNFDIFILPDEERNRGVELRYGKNLLAAALITDTSGVVTRIQPVGKNKDGDPLYIAENNSFVDSARINEYPVIYAKSVQYDVVVSDDLKEEDARALLKEKAEADFAAGCDLANVRLDADFVRLDVTEEYKKVASSYALHLYDKVPVIDRDAGIVVSVRMVAYKYDCLLDRYSATTLGDIGSAEITVYGYEIGGSIQGGKIAPNSMSGDRIRNLSVGYGKFDVAAIRQLSADAIQAIRADIHKLVAEEITTDELYADLAKIAVAQITAANIDKANIQWAEIENLTAAIANIAKAEIGTADINYAKIKDLVTDTAIFTEGVGGKLFVSRLAVTEANMVSLTVGELMLKAADGSFVRLVADGSGGVTTETVEVEGDNIASSTIEGGKLIESTITARELNVSQIFADEALIRAIKAANIDVAELFAAEATIAELNSYLIKASTIEALQGALSLWADEKITLGVSGGVDTGAEGGVQVKITRDTFEVDVPGDKGDLNLNEEGGNIPVLRSDVVTSPTVMPRYAGDSRIYVDPLATSEEIATGWTYRSLQEALDMLSGRVIPGGVTVYIMSGMLYEVARLTGVIVLGRLSIRAYDAANKPVLVGGIALEGCTGRITIANIEIQGNSYYGLDISGCAPSVSVESCRVTGGQYGCIIASDGSNVSVIGSEMYDSPSSIFASTGSRVYMENNRGNCKVSCQKSIIQACGTVPSGSASYFDYSESWAGKVFTENVTVDQGGVAPTVPMVSSISIYAETTTSYEADGGVWNDDNVVQGWWTGGGRIKGCMWFDNGSIRSTLNGKTVLSATLRLTMKSSGCGTAVTVELAGTSANAGGNPPVTKTYGAIATMSPGETATIALPAQVINDLVSGTINGLVLYSSDTGSYKERDYSKNYAAFAGTDGGAENAPMLTVTYEG